MSGRCKRTGYGKFRGFYTKHFADFSSHSASYYTQITLKFFDVSSIDFIEEKNHELMLVRQNVIKANLNLGKMLSRQNVQWAKCCLGELVQGEMLVRRNVT